MPLNSIHPEGVNLMSLATETLQLVGEHLDNVKDLHHLTLVSRRCDEVFFDRLLAAECEPSNRQFPPKYRGPRGNRALDWAVQHGRQDLVRQIFRTGCFFYPDLRRPLELAVLRSDIEMLKILLDKVPEGRLVQLLDRTSPRHYGPPQQYATSKALSLAFREKNVSMIKLFLDRLPGVDSKYSFWHPGPKFGLKKTKYSFTTCLQMAEHYELPQIVLTCLLRSENLAEKWNYFVNAEADQIEMVLDNGFEPDNEIKNWAYWDADLEVEAIFRKRFEPIYYNPFTRQWHGGERLKQKLDRIPRLAPPPSWWEPSW